MKTKKSRLTFYNAYNKVFYWLCGQKYYQNIFFHNKLKPIRSFYQANHPEMSEDEFIQWILFSNWNELRKWFLFGNSWEGIMQQVEIYGKEHLRAAIGKGKGAILITYHTGLPSVSSRALESMGITDFPIRAMRKKLIRDRQIHMPTSASASKVEGYSQLIIQAAEYLVKGGIVRMAADGKRGGSTSILAPFLGRWRDFKAGFAELALATEADVIPFCTTIRSDGTLQIRYFAPLDMGRSGQTRPERLERLVNQYASFMGQQWLNFPSSIKFHKLISYLNQPIVQDASFLPPEKDNPSRRKSFRSYFYKEILIKLAGTIFHFFIRRKPRPDSVRSLIDEKGDRS